MFEKTRRITIYVAGTSQIVVTFDVTATHFAKINDYTFTADGSIFKFADNLYVVVDFEFM